MPNVMGREFSYTPEGMAAAEQYRQAMGMRGGGMMGFRPVGYDNGGTVDVVAELRQKFYELRDLVEAGASGAESELIDLINREQEGLRASNDPKMNEIINNYLSPTPSNFPGVLRDEAPTSDYTTEFGQYLPQEDDYRAPQMTKPLQRKDSELLDPFVREDSFPFYEQPEFWNRPLPDYSYGQDDPGMNFGPVEMRGGGMMGFRPVGYADGDLVEQFESGFLTPSEREQLAGFISMSATGPAIRSMNFLDLPKLLRLPDSKLLELFQIYNKERAAGATPEADLDFEHDAPLELDSRRLIDDYGTAAGPQIEPLTRDNPWTQAEKRARIRSMAAQRRYETDPGFRQLFGDILADLKGRFPYDAPPYGQIPEMAHGGIMSLRRR
jgi:hypothetical protein